jgi:hypothetical protein
MQIVWRTFAFCLVATLALPAWSQTWECSSNGSLGTVSAAAYDAALERSGAFVFKMRDGVSVNVSLIRQWVAFQNCPQVSMMRGERLASADGSSITFRFSYHWDDASVVETLLFDARGVEAAYEFTPWQNRKVGFVAVHLEPRKPFSEKLAFIGLEASCDNERLLEINADNLSQVKGRLAALSMRNAGPLTLDLLGVGNSLFSIERFPNMLLHNVGRPGSWSVDCKAGETLKIGVRLFLSAEGGRNLPASSIAFAPVKGP